MPGIQDRGYHRGNGHAGGRRTESPGPSNGYFSGRPSNGGYPGVNGGPGYYYSRDGGSVGGSSSRPSPSLGGSHTPKMNGPPPHRNGVSNGGPARGRMEEETPSYWAEHLATFAVGRSYGLEKPQDGIRKLKQMERSSAIWAQPMVLRLKPNVVSVEDENGEIVEQFPMHLIAEPTAHLSTDPRDVYNNILLFVVQEDKRQPRTATPTEMHIFQCNRVSANDVVADLSFYLSGQYNKVRPGRRDTGFVPGTEIPQLNGGNGHGPVINSYTRTESREVLPGAGHRVHATQSYSHPPSIPVSVLPHHSSTSQLNPAPPVRLPAIRDDATDSSDTSDYFERDVNTLNRCFDDIERFVSRIQSAALAQREIEAAKANVRRSRSRSRDPGVLNLRAQLPGEFEFVDVLQKFKLCFNLLAKLKNHIHDPNAPELLHFLFTPLTVILDASQWGLGRNIAPQVLSPLLTRDAVELLRNCLTSKETDVWMALGDAWRTPPEDWPGSLPPPYRPIFADGFMPYGAPAVSGTPLPPALPAPSEPRRHRSVDNLSVTIDRFSLEKERLDFEREKVEEEKRRIAERERRVWEEERKINEEKMRLNEDRRTLDQFDQRSVISERPAPSFSQRDYREASAQSSPAARPRVERVERSIPVAVNQTPESPRQRAFLEELRAKRSKIVQVTYDRIGQNQKELTVSKAEYLEVLNDTKKWWECRNVHNRLGYVPHTILGVIQEGDGARGRGGVGYNQPLFVQPGPSSSGPPSSSIQDLSGVGGRGPSSPNRPVEYVDLMNAGVQASLPGPSYRQNGFSSPNHDSPSTAQPTRSVAPPPPGPPPDLTNHRQPAFPRRPTVDNVTRPEPQERTSNGRGPYIETYQRVVEPSQNDRLREELQQTLRKGPSRDDLRIRRNDNAVVSDQASPQEVKEWLEDKGFSARTIQIMKGQNGATIFALTKSQMMEFCGKDEGARLYSQLLVSKNITGYATRSGAELKAILNLRKRVSEANFSPNDLPQPNQPAPQLPPAFSSSSP